MSNHPSTIDFCNGLLVISSDGTIKLSPDIKPDAAAALFLGSLMALWPVICGMQTWENAVILVTHDPSPPEVPTASDMIP